MVDEYCKYFETFEKLCDIFKKMTNEVLMSKHNQWTK